MATNIPDPRTEPTLAPEVAAKLLGFGRSAAYADIRLTGQLAGIDVIRIGRKVRIPTAAVLARLGLDTNTQEEKS